MIGGLTLNTAEETEQTLRVEEAIVHEGYRETTKAVYNDIGDLHFCHILYQISTNIANSIRNERLNKRGFCDTVRFRVVIIFSLVGTCVTKSFIFKFTRSNELLILL